MKKQHISLGISTLASLLVARPAFAICPICTIAVGAGVGLSRWLGVDDTIAGLWIGAIMVAVVLWTIKWFEKKQIVFRWRNEITWLTYYALTVGPLEYAGIIGHPNNTLWGIDKLLIGIIIGTVFFYIGDYIYPILKEKNGGRAHFPFEKVVLPISPLVIFSIIFYSITK